MTLFWRLFPYFAVVWLLVLLVPVRINLFFLRENKDDLLTVRVNTFYSLVRFSVEVPLLKQEAPLDLVMEAELKAGEDELIRERKTRFSLLGIRLEMIWQYAEYLRKNRRMLWFLVRFLARAVTVDAFVLEVAAGTSDAARTGLMAGLFWSAAGAFSALIGQWLTVRKPPEFMFCPYFGPGPRLSVRLDTTVIFRIGHIIIAGLLFLTTKIRGGEQSWRNIPSRA